MYKGMSFDKEHSGIVGTSLRKNMLESATSSLSLCPKKLLPAATCGLPCLPPHHIYIACEPARVILGRRHQKRGGNP